ncbi:MAG: hypothetical protein RIR73_2879, partial [Chloroflexota bacterium]
MIRPYHEDDFNAVTSLWFDAMQVAIPGLMKRMGYTLEGSRAYFKNGIAPEHQLWVYELESQPVAYLAIKDDFIDRLYVRPDLHRHGIGLALLQHARSLSPNHLWLYTNTINNMACAFYEKNGFVAEKYGMSP